MLESKLSSKEKKKNHIGKSYLTAGIQTANNKADASFINYIYTKGSP